MTARTAWRWAAMLLVVATPAAPGCDRCEPVEPDEPCTSELDGQFRCIECDGLTTWFCIGAGSDKRWGLSDVPCHCVGDDGYRDYEACPPQPD